MKRALERKGTPIPVRSAALRAVLEMDPIALTPEAGEKRPGRFIVHKDMPSLV